jgi:hypothetical protein
MFSMSPANGKRYRRLRTIAKPIASSNVPVIKANEPSEAVLSPVRGRPDGITGVVAAPGVATTLPAGISVGVERAVGEVDVGVTELATSELTKVKPVKF